MRTIVDYKKEQARGTLKQIMKVRGLRTISIANYYNWAKKNGVRMNYPTVHSLKLDIQDGYINAYGWNGTKCGEKIEDLSTSEYLNILGVVYEMISKEESGKIPYKERRNIFVKVCR